MYKALIIPAASNPIYDAVPLAWRLHHHPNTCLPCRQKLYDRSAAMVDPDNLKNIAPLRKDGHECVSLIAVECNISMSLRLLLTLSVYGWSTTYPIKHSRHMPFISSFYSIQKKQEFLRFQPIGRCLRID